MIQDTGDQKGEVSIPGYRRSNRRGEEFRSREER